MAVWNSYTVTIGLVPRCACQRAQTEEVAGCTLMVCLLESRQDSLPQFALYDGENPLCTLTADETDTLLRLLSQMMVRVPWDAVVGRDGATFTLRLEGPMSHAEFSWWETVPKGWENIGAVFDYLMLLAKRHGYGSALCG
jgi:hypothetical protein